MPVAVDQHVHRRLDDEEGQFFAQVLTQAGRGLGGRSQGVYLFDADGKLLGFANAADAATVRRLLMSSLARFRARKPDGQEGGVGDEAAPTDVDAESSRLSGPDPEPPSGGLVAVVTSKVLGGYGQPSDERTRRHAESVGLDHLWLRRDEHEALARGELPESVTRRLVRFHLVDNTRGEPPFWREDEIRESTWALEAGLLTGRVVVESTDGSRSFRAAVRGRVESKEGAVTRLDIVARGLYRGHGTYTRGAPEGEFPFAVTVRLIEPLRVVDRVLPGGARRNLRGYLR